MATNKKISALNEAASLNPDDYIPIVQSEETKKVKYDTLRTLFSCPIGSIMGYSGSGDPNDSDWILCDGRSLPIPAGPEDPYYSIYQIIGNTYGSDADVFKIPDLRARVPLGKNSTIGLPNRSIRSTGETGGEEDHLLSVDELPSHNHDGSVASGGSHTHAFRQNDADAGALTYLYSRFLGTAPSPVGVFADTGTGAAYQALIATGGSHTHTIPSQGANTKHNNMPPYLVINYIIKIN